MAGFRQKPQRTTFGFCLNSRATADLARRDHRAFEEGEQSFVLVPGWSSLVVGGERTKRVNVEVVFWPYFESWKVFGSIYGGSDRRWRRWPGGNGSWK